MNPLARLIRTRMEEKGWSTYDVARQGGPPARTLQHLADPSVEWRVTPLPTTLERVAAGLQLPLSEVREAANATVAHKNVDGTATPPTPHIGRVVALMEELPEQRQAQVVDLVARMIETWREEPPLTLLPAANRGRRTDAVDTAKKAAAERKKQQKK